MDEMSKKTAYDVLDKLRDHVNGGNMFTIPIGKRVFGYTPMAHIYKIEGTELICHNNVTLYDNYLKQLSADQIIFWTKP
jgi:hypothetical protein